MVYGIPIDVIAVYFHEFVYPNRISKHFQLYKCHIRPPPPRLYGPKVIYLQTPALYTCTATKRQYFTNTNRCNSDIFS